MRLPLIQQAFLRKKIGVDGFGQPQYDDPIEVYVRWEDAAEQFTTNDGRELVSRAVVMVDRDMNPGDLLQRAGVEEAQEIRHFEVVPTIKGRSNVRTAFI